MKEREVQAIKENEHRLKESEMQTQESLVSEGATLEAILDDNLVAQQCTVDSTTSSEQQNESNGSRNESSSSGNDADADIGPLYDSDIVSLVHHDMFENMFLHEIQNHEQPKSVLDTYVVIENNSNIMADIPNMDPDRNKEEHDYVNYEAQQANALLTKELERYKEKEKHFAKDKTIESEYCKKIKLLNDEISNLKYQNAHTLHMLLPKEDSVHTGKQGLGFENQNDVENLFVLNKAKELAPILYDIDEMGKELLSDHKFIYAEELKSEEKKILFENETSSFETKIKELEMILAHQTKDFENAKVDIRDSNVEKDQFLKQIASLESKLESQDLLSIQKEYSDLRTSYNALKAKFDSLNRDKEKSLVSNFQKSKVSVSKKIYMALRWLLEEIHVTWALLKKKRTRLQLYTRSLEENAYNGWRWRHIQSRRRQSLQRTASKLWRWRQDPTDLKKP
ncbi:hypothetical protein Tco_1156553 [Tanacetum coccineum]